MILTNIIHITYQTNVCSPTAHKSADSKHELQVVLSNRLCPFA